MTSLAIVYLSVAGIAAFVDGFVVAISHVEATYSRAKHNRETGAIVFAFILIWPLAIFILAWYGFRLLHQRTTGTESSAPRLTRKQQRTLAYETQLLEITRERVATQRVYEDLLLR